MANAARDTPADSPRVHSTAAHVLGNRLVIAALVTSPLMYLIELIAPQWVIYCFRAGWVALVAVAAVVVARERRSTRRPRAIVSSDRTDERI
ncbi:MAG: hypothetical protein M3Y51_06835 [Actinomycetota bacterium]|nr:hypothetical protein [Actinomycetota bacterium]